MKRFCLVISFLLLFSLAACSVSPMSTDKALSRIMEKGEKLPDGMIYHLGAEEGSEYYLPPSVRDSMYGDASEEIFSLLEDYSIYMSSFAKPFEIAVFKCRSKSDGRRIEAMCRDRRDIVSVALRETEFYEMCRDIRIIRDGEWVFFIMSDEPDVMARTARHLT